MLDIPLPEDDDYSEDEFDGYLSEGDENGDGYSGERGGSGDEDGDEDEDMGEEDDNTTIPSYAGTPGCTQDMSNKSPLEFLELFITDEMLMTIQQQTILYAEQYISSNTISRRSRVKQWNRPPAHDLGGTDVPGHGDSDGAGQPPKGGRLLGDVLAFCIPRLVKVSITITLVTYITQTFTCRVPCAIDLIYSVKCLHVCLPVAIAYSNTCFFSGSSVETGSPSSLSFCT